MNHQFFSQMTFWKGESSTPILHHGKALRYTTKEAVEVLVSKDFDSRTCKVRPLKVRENASFLVDVSKESNWEDVKDDMNGVYSGVLRCAIWTVEIDALNNSMDVSVVEKKEISLTGANQYHLVMNSKTNKACPKLVRSIFILKDSLGSIVNQRCLVQYHIPCGEKSVDFCVAAHGNSSKRKHMPFYPTRKSTLDHMKLKVQQDQSAGNIYKEAVKVAGGPETASTRGELPRSRRQIYDLKAKAKSQGDPVDELLIYARQKDDGVVLRHEDLPLDVWVLGTEIMCNDLVKFTTIEDESYPFTVDPTFNMGRYEVTPVVYKNLLLKSTRTGEHPIFLGPTMIHHRKDFQTFKVLSSTCSTNCKGLEKAKGFITDGEEELVKAWKSEIPKAKHLRCVKHFENNCKDKLREIGIRETKLQKMFLNPVFGVTGKVEGVIDGYDKKDVKNRIRECKESLDKKEAEVLQKNADYQTQFSTYLWNRRDVMGKTMSLKAREKAGMPKDPSGKPLRPYTNTSESMNNVMTRAKEAFLRQCGRSSGEPLSKVEFTKHIFEDIHAKEQHELTLALIGQSEEYEMSDVATHLSVPVDDWFDWSKEQRSEYVAKFNKMSIEDVKNGKSILVKSTIINEESEGSTSNEFREFSADPAVVLREKFKYKEEIVNAVTDGALALLNMPAAIQLQSTFDAAKPKRYEVASKSAKYGRVVCTVNKTHVRCSCPAYKFDSVCKHSIAVAAKAGILQTHLQVISKAPKKGCRTALAEGSVDKQVAGKKGSRNKNAYRPARKTTTNSKESSSDVNDQTSPLNGQIYTEIYHNDNPFVLQILPEQAKRCGHCKKDFCHRQRIIPLDLVFQHSERWYFPVNGDWNKKQASNKETSRFYHAAPTCIQGRFPYFNNDYIEVPEDIKIQLQDSHKSYLINEFSYEI